MVEIGEFEAEIDLEALLDRVEQGEEISITRAGRPVARLVPAERTFDRAEAVSAMERIRKRALGTKAQFDFAEFKQDRDAGRP